PTVEPLVTVTVTSSLAACNNSGRPLFRKRAFLCYCRRMTEPIIAAVEEEHVQPLNPRQKKLVLLLLEVEQGKMSLTDALKKAGYADSTAEQQSETLNRLRENSAMQMALRKAG